MKTFLWIKAEMDQVRSALEQIQSIEGIIESATTDNGLYAIVASFEDDKDHIAEIKKIPGIESVDIYIETVKD